MPLVGKRLGIMVSMVLAATLLLAFLFHIYAIPFAPTVFFFSMVFLYAFTVIGLIAFYIVDGSVLFDSGLSALGFAFISSLFVGVGYLGEYYRVVAILEYNPNRVAFMVRDVFSYGILPIAVGLAICVLAWIRCRKGFSGCFRSLPLLIIGGLLILWSFYYFRAVQGDYLEAVRWTAQERISQVDDSLRAFYSAHAWVAVLWMITGGFFVAISSYAMLKLRSRNEVSVA